MADALMLRHCESAGWWPDAPLTPEGYEQATRLVDTLAESSVDHIVSSPFRRAYESIAPFAQSRGLEIHTDERLAERKRSDKPLENWREWVRQSFSNVDFRAPGGESGREVARRGADVLISCLESNHGLALLSTHGQLMSFLANSLDPEFGYEEARSMAYPALYRFRSTDSVITFEPVA